MGRPRKAGKLKMDTDLRIPVTHDQKKLNAKATAGEPEEMAAWARAILLRAAEDQLARIEKAKQHQK